MEAYIGVTDWDWYQFLSARGATEVNFWQPSGGRRFAAVRPGSPFLFKTHFSHGNRIVGGGFLSGWASLPVSRAWEFFEQDNGCIDLDQMQARIRHYRRGRTDAGTDPEVGCVMLRDVRFLPPHQALDPPPTWAPNIVQGRSYDATSAEAGYVLELLETVFSAPAAPPEATEASAVPGAVFGPQRPAPVRVGQRAFKALVQEAYGRRCAITGDKIVPVLQAAHIRPVTAQGENRVDNGLLLRSDVHTLYDRGYLAVHPERKTLLVSPRLRADWGNGEEFYGRAASNTPIVLPPRRTDRPNADFLTWHSDTVFMAS